VIGRRGSPPRAAARRCPSSFEEGRQEILCRPSSNEEGQAARQRGQGGARLKRRAFTALIGGAAMLTPLAARAQQPGRLPTIGFLRSNTASGQSQQTNVFVQRLRELGWIEGRIDRVPEILAEFVQLKVDVVVTNTTANVAAAKRATSTIPIVFAGAADPPGAGLIDSLARPGGNATGLALQQTDIAGKRLELLRAIVPKLGRLASMTNVGAPGAVPERREVEAAARMLGLEVLASEVRQAEDIAPAIEALKSRVDALYVYTDPLMATHRTRLNILAQGARLATIYGNREYVDAGGLMSYGVNYANQFRRTAQIVDKILRGTSPADIPVEQPTTFELVVNLKTARALGLAIPEYLLQRADEVIE